MSARRPQTGADTVGHPERLRARSALGAVPQQAGVLPATPAHCTPDANGIDSTGPGARATPRAPSPAAPPGTSLVGWVTGPDSLNDTVKKFAITGTDLGIMWDNGDAATQVLMASGHTYGYCSVRGQQWRYNVFFPSKDGALSKTISVPNGAVGNSHSGSPLWAPGLSKQIINSIKWAPRRRASFRPPPIRRREAVHQLHVHQELGSDGRWTTNFSAIAVSPDNGERWGVYPKLRFAPPRRATSTGPRDVPGNENFQQGAFLKPGPGDPYLYSSGHRPAAAARRSFPGRPGLAGPHPLRILELRRERLGPRQSGSCDAGDPRPGRRDVRPIQRLPKAVPGAVLQWRQRRRMQGPRPRRKGRGPRGRCSSRQGEIPGGIYAPYLHPWSTGKELYFNLSQWTTTT